MGALLTASLALHASAHTWIEEMQVIGSNGSYIGDRGFSRGYMARTDPGFNGDSDLWMLPSLDARNPDESVRSRINGSDLLCHPSQRSSNYSNPAYPKLKATPGGHVAMKYLENGHVTLPWTLTGKPKNGGTVLVFGTTNPRAEEKIVDVMQWTKDGSGGDGRGFLMGAMDYDDGECHQLNTCWMSGERQILYPNRVPDQPDSSVERWCESDIQIPAYVSTGPLTAYWIWDWGTEAGKDCLAPDGKDQYYTNCADFDIVADDGDPAAGNAKIATEANTNTLAQQDPNTRAVRNYASRTAVNTWSLMTAANWADFNVKAAATPSATANASWASFCSTSILAQQSAAAANPNSLPPSCPPGSYAPTGASFSAWSASIKAKATNLPADSPAPAPTSNAPAMTAAPATSAPAAPSMQAPPDSAPSQAAASGAVVTVTETEMSISTMTTYVASSAAPSVPSSYAPSAQSAASAAAPAGPESSPPAAPPAASVAPPTGPSNTGGAPPYAVNAGPKGMGGEHRPPPRRHARHFGRSTK